MSKFPICVVIYLTDYCNTRCKHCFLTQTDSFNKNIIDFNILKELLITLKNNNVFMIAYTGGDPMLHPQILEILKLTSELGMLPLLGISGTNMNDEMSKKIYESGVRCVQLGLNGSTAKLNDLYRGKGNYKEILNTIKHLQSNNINVNIAFCLDKNNLFDLENMLTMAYKKKIYKVKIEFWNCINPSDERRKKELSRDERKTVGKICEDYMIKIKQNDWIQYPKSNKKLSNIHSKAIIIMPNGDVKNNEMSESLGNIYKEDIGKIMEDV